jgi:hypothetical protein
LPVKEIAAVETVVPAPASDLSAKSVETVEPKPKNEFLAQLNERLATENLRKERIAEPSVKL